MNFNKRLVEVEDGACAGAGLRTMNIGSSHARSSARSRFIRSHRHCPCLRLPTARPSSPADFDKAKQAASRFWSRSAHPGARPARRRSHPLRAEGPAAFKDLASFEVDFDSQRTRCDSSTCSSRARSSSSRVARRSRAQRVRPRRRPSKACSPRRSEEPAMIGTIGIRPAGRRALGPPRRACCRWCPSCSALPRPSIASVPSPSRADWRCPSRPSGLFVATIGFAVGLDAGLFRTAAALVLVGIGLC